MAAPKPDIAVLRTVPLFHDLADADLHALSACLRLKRLGEGDLLFRQGSRGETMVIVLTGTLRSELRRDDGTVVPLPSARVGEVVGEMACIDPAPRTATVTAAETSVVAELSRDALDALRSAAPGVFARIVGRVIVDVTRRLRELEGRLSEEPPGSLEPGKQAPVVGSKGTRSASAPSASTDAAPPVEAQEGFGGFLDRIRGLFG